MNLSLIGPRGVGKTRTARRLAVLLRRPVVGTDVLVSYECGGRSIANLIRQKGGGVQAWRYFRQKELAVLRKISKLKDVIIDCGGGIVVDLDRRGAERFSLRKARLLRKNSIVIWLKSDIDRLVKKTASDPRRPKLSSAEDIREILRRRDPYYAKAAHVEVSAHEHGAKTLANRILKKIRRQIGTP